MFINVKSFSNNNNSATYDRLSLYSGYVLVISIGIYYLSFQVAYYRQSIGLSGKENVTFDNMLSLCKISYEDCRCSSSSNKSNSSRHCITDMEAMAAHILPMVSYLLQLYIISKVFWVTGKYRHIITEILRIAAFLIFIFISVVDHRSSCLHEFTSIIISGTGSLLFLFITSFTHPAQEYYWRPKRRKRNRKEKLVTNSHDDEKITIVVGP